MNNKTDNISKSVISKKQWTLFLTGFIAIITGICISGFFCGRKVYREIQKRKLLRENPVIEIANIGVKAPILEGTDKDILARAVGHFENTGNIGSGNYCIAGHSSTIYKEYFNNLKKIEKGDEIVVYDKNKNKYIYITDNIKIVNPDETYILNDFGDDRITIITCTDSGKQRLVVVGNLSVINNN